MNCLFVIQVEVSRRQLNIDSGAYGRSEEIHIWDRSTDTFKVMGLGWAQWLKPIIPALWEAEAGDHLRLGVWDQPGQHGETLFLLKIQKIGWAWWRMPVIPATWEAEAGELLEPRRRRLQWAEIVPLHSSLGNKSETPSQKKILKISVVFYQDGFCDHPLHHITRNWHMFFLFPGIITKANELLFLHVYEFDEVMFLKNVRCSTCDLRKPARSKHCSECGSHGSSGTPNSTRVGFVCERMFPES